MVSIFSFPNPKGLPNFGRGYIGSNIFSNVGGTFKVGTDKNCRFWQDSWLNDVSLKIYYEDLYKMVKNTECSVAKCWVEHDWFIDFRRSLSRDRKSVV